MKEFQITPQELKQRMAGGEQPFLLDVREPHEFKTANLGGTLIPLGELPSRLHEIDPDREIVVICHHGIRSMQATAFLHGQGFAKVKNLKGGIDRWTIEIDPSVPRY